MEGVQSPPRLIIYPGPAAIRRQARAWNGQAPFAPSPVPPETARNRCFSPKPLEANGLAAKSHKKRKRRPNSHPFCVFCASSRQRGSPHLSRQMAHAPSNRLRTIVFQAGLKAGFCPALASSSPVLRKRNFLFRRDSCFKLRSWSPNESVLDGVFG